MISKQGETLNFLKDTRYNSKSKRVRTRLGLSSRVAWNCMRVVLDPSKSSLRLYLILQSIKKCWKFQKLNIKKLMK